MENVKFRRYFHEPSGMFSKFFELSGKFEKFLADFGTFLNIYENPTNLWKI